MGAVILPFSAEHVEAAAELLAARHRRDRTRARSLPSEYEDAAATLPLLRDLLAADGTSGVVALRERSVVGYVLGAPELGSPTRAFAGVMHPRAAEIPYAGHAAKPGDAQMVYPLMYAALAERWVGDGLVGHYATVPSDPILTETWSNLGFGRFIALGVRSTEPRAERVASPPVEIEVRRATPEDAGEVESLVTELVRSFAEPPIFVPFLPETTGDRLRSTAEHLADPGCPHWLAFAQGRSVGFHRFVEPTSSLWHQSAMESAPRGVYLFLAYTVPEARGSGVGAALVDHSMAWARAAGYDVCLAHWLTASRAAGFWQRIGFRPVSYWLRRFIDERATWARG